MDILIQILILFIFINTLVKLSFWKLWQVVLFTLVYGLFLFIASPYATQSSKVEFQGLMQNSTILADISVMITIESALCLAFVFTAFHQKYHDNKKVWVKLLYWYPTLMLFPALYYLLAQTFYAFPGVSFDGITYGMMAAVVVGLSLFSYLLRAFLPEKSIRLEVQLLSALFVCVLGLITTGSSQVVYAAPEVITGSSVTVVYALMVIVTVIILGIGVHKWKWIIKDRARRKREQHS